MSRRDTIDGKTAAEAILSNIIELVANMPESKAVHARSAIMLVNRMVAKHLFTPSDVPHHHRVATVSELCSQAAERPYIDSYEKQVYANAADTARDFYDAVMYHSNMEAPLPF